MWRMHRGNSPTAMPSKMACSERARTTSTFRTVCINLSSLFFLLLLGLFFAVGGGPLLEPFGRTTKGGKLVSASP